MEKRPRPQCRDSSLEANDEGFKWGILGTAILEQDAMPRCAGTRDINDQFDRRMQVNSRHCERRTGVGARLGTRGRMLFFIAFIVPGVDVKTCLAQGAASTFGNANDVMRDPTSAESSRIQVILGYPNYPWAFTPQSNVRYFVFKRSEMAELGSDFGTFDGLTGDGTNPDGEYEVGVEEDTLKKPPSEAAPILDHELGHVKNQEDGKDDLDHVVDANGDPVENPAGKQEHFRTYESGAMALCNYICILCTIGFHLESPAALCAIYESMRNKANKELWPHFPASDQPPKIPACECCPCQ